MAERYSTRVGADVETEKHHHLHPEGRLTTIVEEQTSRVPSVLYLTLAMGSLAASAALIMSRRRDYREVGIMIGQFVPSLLVIGLYNKMVKRLGH